MATWKLIGKLTGIVGLKDINEKPDMLNAFIKHQVNRYSYVVNNKGRNDKIVFSIEYEPREGKVKIITNQFPVIKADCDNVLNLLDESLKVIKTLLIINLNSVDENYDLIITVDDESNAFDKLNKTMFTHSTIHLNTVNVHVSKNKVQISARDFKSLKNSVLNFVC